MHLLAFADMCSKKIRLSSRISSYVTAVVFRSGGYRGGGGVRGVQIIWGGGVAGGGVAGGGV